MCEATLEVTDVTVETRKRANHPLLPKLDAAEAAVYEADREWMEALDSPEAKAAYKAAKAAYKALADEAVAKGVSDDCGRCGGDGGWVGWPGFTCFDCGGSGLGSWKPVRFQASPPTRAKREAEQRVVAEAKQSAREEKWAAFTREHPAEASVMEFEHRKMVGGGDYSFLGSLWDKVGDYGSLTEKQFACVTREMEKRVEEAAAVEFPRGTVTVEGEIVSLPESRGYYGSSKTNMLVKLTSHPGNKVMGSVPAKVWEAMSDGEGQTGHVVGSCVRFTATLTKGDRDDHFGFFKSPKQVEVLSVNRSDS